MKSLIRFSLATACAVAFANSAGATLNVVATVPDFACIAKAVGGDNVKVSAIAKGTEDPHFVDARPSFIRVLNKADVLLDGGLELEIGWLPPLVNNARNKKILLGASGRIIMSAGIPVIQVPATLDRAMGDVHPLGNPHFFEDPAFAPLMAANVANGLSKLDPANAAAYQANLQAFDKRLNEKLKEWTRAMAPFRGTKVLTYHKSFDYLLQRFGLELAGTIEPVPGIEPSPTHISTLVPRAKEHGVKLVIIEPFRPRKTPEYVASSIGAKLILIPDAVAGEQTLESYIARFDEVIRLLLNALKGN